MRRHLTTIAKALSLCITIILILSGCSGAGSLGAGENTISVAMVANAQMTDAEKLATEFQAENPGHALQVGDRSGDRWLPPTRQTARIHEDK